jgi:endonuclease-3 related protein
MSMIASQLIEIYQLLYERFGPQKWWPGQTTFEIIAGAILTQNTNWKNVEKAISNLKAADVLEPQKIKNLQMQKLAELIRPAGYFNIKAKRLKNFVNWLFENYNGLLEYLQKTTTEQLRAELLGITGIGPETADSILLYALERPVFVVDAYTARVAVRHHLSEPEIDYEQLSHLFQSNLQEDLQLFNEYHALLVRVGKEFCKPKPICKGCPLEHLPHTIEPACS